MTFTEEEARRHHGDDARQCPNCGGWFGGGPELCHACATGLAQSGRSKGYHPRLGRGSE